MTDKELMQQALEDICAAKLCEINSMSSRHEMIRLMDKAIAALRERLAQPETIGVVPAMKEGKDFTISKPWVGLTDEEISEVLGSDIHLEQSGELRFIRAIEAKLRGKNT